MTASLDSRLGAEAIPNQPVELSEGVALSRSSPRRPHRRLLRMRSIAAAGSANSRKIHATGVYQARPWLCVDSGGRGDGQDSHFFTSLGVRAWACARSNSGRPC
jgi:hypothetical protein